MTSTLEFDRTGSARAGSDDGMSDEQLLLEYRTTGDRDLFDELVHRFERELYSYLRRYLGDAAMAEDVFQLTFLQVHLKCDQFDRGRRFRPWLYTIATNQAIDAQRRNRRHRMVSLDSAGPAGEQDDLTSLARLLASNQPGPIDKLETEERRAWVREATDQLPEQLRSAVALVYYQGMKYREAAEVLDIPVGTIKSRLHSAILKLNEAWNHSPTDSRPDDYAGGGHTPQK
ncbi:MAG: RNA polymerase sigma factor [Planctomycetes bacterium]|nr:RNA polymerase sigma factor [Planctomycetota bacterium]